MNDDAYPRLLADLGGTSLRMALQRAAGAPLTDVETVACDDHASLDAALRSYLRAHGDPHVRCAAIGVATAVRGDDLVRMTNRDWSFSIAALRAALGLQRLVVLNDFAALALSLPALGASELWQIGGGAVIAGQPLALIGPGTGLGVSALLPTPVGWRPIAGEGGHATLAAADDREAALIAALRRRFGHVSAERVLSGPGLGNLRSAIAELDGAPAGTEDAARIVAEAASGSDALSVAAVDTFLAMLGSVAGNLALTYGAGAVYIGGGIVPRLGRAAVERSRLRERFEAKGRFGDYLAPIPLFVIDSAVPPALIGAACALDQDDSAAASPPIT